MFWDLKNNFLIKLFSSITTAIILLVIISLSSVIGTLIQQNQEFIFYKKNFPQYCDWIYLFSLNDLYHSIWFTALIVLLCLNITVCTLRRFTSRLRTASIVNVDINSDFIDNCRLKRNILKVSNEEAHSIISSKIKGAGYTLQVKDFDGRSCFFGNYGAYSFMGEFLVHVSLLMIITGALAGNIFGYKMQMEGFPGDVRQVPSKAYYDLQSRINAVYEKSLAEGRDSHEEIGKLMEQVRSLPQKSVFELRIDDFKTVYADEGPTGEVHVKNWYTTLSVLSGTTPVYTKTLSVNDPMSYSGMNIYQSSFGTSAAGYKNFRIFYREPGAGTVETAFVIPETERSNEVVFKSFRIRALKFLPDFKIDMDTKQAYSASNEPRNPALKIELLPEGTAEVVTQWLFKNMPDFSHDGMGGGKIPGRFILSDFEADEKQYTGIQIAYDPGVGLVWAGCALMMAGFFWAFYFFHKRIWCVLDKKNAVIYLGGSSNKNHCFFEDEFNELCSKIESEVKK